MRGRGTQEFVIWLLVIIGCCNCYIVHRGMKELLQCRELAVNVTRVLRSVKKRNGLGAECSVYNVQAIEGQATKIGRLADRRRVLRVTSVDSSTYIGTIKSRY
jgi:hypothetical protein